ncbi:transposase domain-containing protein [Hungatella effluvii]|uniref:transposase domain-containing protein n=1 Tax=Hungatella effluvii TaxID=1096246 RepID=UPI0022E17147|nr:transposase domain-containing protein [Hungatella effluvii]
MAETTKANKLKPYEYFRHLLERLPKHGKSEDLSYNDQLLPWSETLPECYC